MTHPMIESLYAEAGYEVMSAPNRYRKLLPKLTQPVHLQPDHEVDTAASPGMRMLVLEGLCIGNMPVVSMLMWRAREMMAEDWPEKADRIVGYEPSICLTDELLIWEAA